MDPTVKLIEDLADLAVGRTTATPPITASSERTDLYRHLSSAADNAAVDELPRPVGRGRATKVFVLKTARFALVRQRAVNYGLVGVTNEMLAQLDALAAQIEQERRRAAGATAASEAKLASLARSNMDRLDELRSALTTSADAQQRAFGGRVDAAVAEFEGLLEQRSGPAVIAEAVATALAAALEPVVADLDEQRQIVADLQADLALERHRREVLDRELRTLRAVGRRTVEGDDPPAADNTDQTSTDSSLSELYDRFEAHFRPVGTDLTTRFEEYVADLGHLSGGHHAVLDIGTGRGDFLKVLRDAGIPARGVDSNADAVARAMADGLQVDCRDAFELLAELPGESVGAVTAFHVVEHLPPKTLLDLIDEIVRVLVPGGLVILETPNPTNLVVGAATFYHDPTHLRPVTPDYLAFLLRDRGLRDVETRFLHPLPEYGLDLGIDTGERHGQRALGALLKDVQWALKGPMDFAVIGRSPSAT